MEKILHLMEIGGPMMVPLAGLAFIGMIIFLERLLYLHKGQIKAVEFVSGIKEALKKRRVLEAITICDETYGPIPRIVKSALVSYEGTYTNEFAQVAADTLGMTDPEAK